MDTGPLSSRELEVARLVASGVTNREIAATLTMAPRTASSHLEYILTKLGFSRRAEIAARAARRPCPALVAAEMPLSVSNPLRRDSFWHLDARCERVRVTGVEVCGFGASVPLESHGPLDTGVRVRDPCHRG